MISLVLVNYHTVEPIAALLDSPHGADEVVIVDHSGSDDEWARLTALPADRLVRQENMGYGAGLNRGAQEARGDTLVFSNPDILYIEGALNCLARALNDTGAGLAGLQLYWDEGLRWMLPVTTPYTWRYELRRRWWLKGATEGYLRSQLKLWEADAPMDAPALSGAVMAASREAFESVGGFDQRFFLFFEENDLFLRMIREGWRMVHVPEAKAVHAGGSSLEKGDAERHYRQSMDRFREKHFPSWYRKLAPVPPRWREPASLDSPPPKPHQGDLLLLSPYPSMIPATARLWVPESRVPGEGLPEHLPPGTYSLMVYRDGAFRDRGHLRVE